VAMEERSMAIDERRHHSRARILGPAKINLAGPDLLMHCLVIDWSQGGARIQLEDPSLCPDSFVLIGADDWFEPCCVAWRKADKIGVRFLTGVHPGMVYAEVQSRAKITPKTVKQVQFLLQGCLIAIASASLNACRGLRATKSAARCRS
jgi:hypothetical protein